MSKHGAQEPLLDAVIRLDSLPPEGRRIAVKATGEQRERLAERLDISSIERLEARLEAIKFKGGIEVRGRLEAEITQPCVVTLEPVTQTIDEPVDRIFLPGGEETATYQPGAEVYVDLEDENLPDRFEGAEVDLSELLIEVLSLAIDPYPRKQDAEIPSEFGSDGEADEESPFSRLKDFKPAKD